MLCWLRKSATGGRTVQMTSPRGFNKVKQGLYFTTSSSPAGVVNSPASLVTLSTFCRKGASRTASRLIPRKNYSDAIDRISATRKQGLPVRRPGDATKAPPLSKPLRSGPGNPANVRPSKISIVGAS